MDWRPLSRVVPAAFSGRVDVKFRDGVPVPVEGAVLGPGPARDALARAGVGSPRVVSVSLGLSPEDAGALAAEASRRCDCDVADLSTYLRLAVEEQGADLHALLERLNAAPEVEVAYPLPRLAPLPGDLPPTTPDFTGQQPYLLAPPAGLGVTQVRGLPGGDGAGVWFLDMEIDWTSTHEDLEGCVDRQVPGVGTIYPGLEYQYYRAHGTAVLGMVVGGDNGFGVQGMAPGAVCNYVPQYTWEHGDDTPRALLAALNRGVVGPGDVALLESQVGGPDYTGTSDEGLVPSEWIPANYDAIRTLTAAGVIVVEAAGNGYEDLDHAKFGGAFTGARADSGAIIVGAGSAPLPGQGPRCPLDFSNTGSRVDLQGWGEAVTAAGYGDLFAGGNDERQFYTAQFAGTSSASPMVASAAILVQAIQEAGGGDLITPVAMRALLRDTGTPQQCEARGNIGPQPDIPAAVAGAQVCGNGRRDVGERCEDGNTVDGDGCSADCRSNETCGNGVPDGPVGEQCDDGNTVGGDGCSADCRSNETCGNAIRDDTLGEVCDDGNTAGGDGCSADCRSNETCGNGLLDTAAGEECDDGNTDGSDGCSPACQVEVRPSFLPDGVGPSCTCQADLGGPPGLMAWLALMVVWGRRRRRFS
jgi:uncharacterized protein (TIGR03382 family)